jgi:8-oxo-dGTP pyrophosphatase MutT (NUDIX family)
MAKNDPATMTSAEFFDRARARLRFDIPAGLTDPASIPASGDQGTDRMLEILAREQPIRPAAVLIAVIDRPQPTVLLTQRSAHLNDHAGQISFPGGKIDAGETPLEAALRETEEEIGLSRDALEPLGYLDLYMTTLGYRIVPLIARFAPPFKLALNKNEVDEVFEVPLSFLMEPKNLQRHSRDWQGLTRSYYAIPFEKRYIWGVTAGILRNLHERIYAE